MVGAPTFSSFPDLPELSAGPSKAPSFSSFPDIGLGEPKSSTKEKKRSRDPSEEADRDRRRRRDRSRDRESRHGDRDEERRRRDRSRDRHERKRRDRDRTDEREEGRRRDEHGREKDRARDRDRGRDHHEDRERRRDRHHEREKDGQDRDRDDRRERERGKSEKRSARHEDDERRKEKEDRRLRERERAAELAESGAKDVPPRIEDDGVPWYESRAVASQTTVASMPSKAFFLDTVGDRDIARWNLTSSDSTPRYRRDAGGRVLGLHDGLRIVHSRERTQKGVEVAKMGRPYIPRYSAKPLEGSASRHLGRILLRPSTEEREPLGDFTLIHRRAIKAASDLPDYRAISHEKAESEDELEAVLGQVTTLQDRLKEKRVEFERHLTQNPGDVQKWIDYSSLHLQEAPSAITQPGVDLAKLPTTRANAEVTLSVLERALNAHRANFDSPELHTAFLRAAGAFWPTEKVTERWKNVIRQLSERVPEEDMISLYLGYIEWQEEHAFEGNGSGVGVDTVMDVYVEILDRLRFATDPNNVEIREENMVYIFLRACLFLKQAGYTERALGAFQAIMEITFFKPDHLRAPAPPFDRGLWFAGVMQEFEDFWDFEIPRIGEDGGKGWKEMHASLEEATVPKSKTPNFTSEASDPYERWLDTEREAEKVFALPGRARDLDAPDDDPFHVILFEDVAPLLFPVQSPMARLQLIYAFFNFLGLPFSPPDAPTSSPASTDPHLRWSLVQNESLRAAFWPPRPSLKRIAWQTVGGEPMEVEAPRAMRSPFGCPVKSWISSRDTLFAGNHWFRDITALDLAHVDVNLARNVLTVLRPLVPDPTFVLNIFALETALSPKTGLKAVKDILSTDSRKLALWDGYARLERQRGRIPAARKVYVTAIKSAIEVGKGLQDNVDVKLDEAELWASWAEMEWEEGNEERCLEVIVMAAGWQADRMDDCLEPSYRPQAPTSIAFLKSKQHYAALTPDTPSTLLLGILFTYYSEGMEAAKDRLTGLIDKLPEGSPQSEELYQLLVKVVHLHTSRHSTSASLARNILEEAITKFPNNTEFLSLYLWGEASGRVYGRIQRLVSDLTGEDKGIVAMLWSVWAEAISAARTFWDPRGGGAERVRRALDRGINTASGKRSAALWMLYIEFEIMMGRPASAKALCYRAIATVGGCKELYLLPFSAALRSHFTPRELGSIAESMSERGIRLRVPPDAFWTDVEEDEEEGSDGEPAPITGDYEYGMLREREELKPY